MLERKIPHKRIKRRYTNIIKTDAVYSATVWTELTWLRWSISACLTHNVMTVLLTWKAQYCYPSERLLTRCIRGISPDIQKIFILSFSLAVFEWVSLTQLQLMIALYIHLPRLYDSLQLNVLPWRIIFAGTWLHNLCKSISLSLLLLIFRHDSKLNLFDFNSYVVFYFVSHSALLRALIYTIRDYVESTG